MSEYIEREAAIENIKDTFLGASEFANDTRNAAINAVNSVSTADVQEVVRCKDCKYSSFIRHCSKYECTRFDDRVFFPDDFCSYGVKMDKE